MTSRKPRSRTAGVTFTDGLDMTHPFLNLIISLTQQILPFLWWERRSESLSRRHRWQTAPGIGHVLHVTWVTLYKHCQRRQQWCITSFFTRVFMSLLTQFWQYYKKKKNKKKWQLYVTEQQPASSSFFMQINYPFFFFLYVYRLKSSWCYRGYPCRGAAAWAQAENDNKMFHGTLPGIRFNKSH